MGINEQTQTGRDAAKARESVFAITDGENQQKLINLNGSVSGTSGTISPTTTDKKDEKKFAKNQRVKDVTDFIILDEMLQTAEAQLEALEQTYAQIEAMISLNQARTLAAQQALAAANRQYAADEALRIDIQVEMDSTTIEISQYNTEIDTLNSEIAVQQTEADTAANTASTAHSAALDAQGTDNEEQTTEEFLADYEKSLLELSDVVLAEMEKNGIEVKKKGCEERYEELDGQLTEIDLRMTATQLEISALEQKLAELGEERQGLEAQKADILLQIEAKKAEIADLKEQKNHLGEQQNEVACTADFNASAVEGANAFVFTDADADADTDSEVAASEGDAIEDAFVDEEELLAYTIAGPTGPNLSESYITDRYALYSMIRDGNISPHALSDPTLEKVAEDMGYTGRDLKNMMDDIKLHHSDDPAIREFFRAYEEQARTAKLETQGPSHERDLSLQPGMGGMG